MLVEACFATEYRKQGNLAGICIPSLQPRQQLRGVRGLCGELRRHLQVLPQRLGEGHGLDGALAGLVEHGLEAAAGLVHLVPGGQGGGGEKHNSQDEKEGEIV